MKIFSVTVQEENGQLSMDRINNGFSAIELMGLLEMTMREVRQQMVGEMKPDVVTRTAIVDED